MIDEVSAAVAQIGGEGEFAIEESCKVDDLELRVQGVGHPRLPLRPADIRKLIGVARPAPFGVRDQTRYDETVRSTWEIGADQLTLPDAWNGAIASRLDVIRRRLGFSRDGEVRAVLDKLLIYEPGQFFQPHQDSERFDGMLATLVVVLPSKHTGGEIIVHHKKSQLSLGTSDRSGHATLVAFYADCRHEVKPVRTGHRITLTYHVVQDSTVPRARPHRSAPVDRLAASIHTYFSTPVKPYYSDDPGEVPDRLVYLLDHEYSQKGLDWKRLKGADRERVQALLTVADQLDCEVFLALADVHEQWSCEEDDDSWDRRRHDDFEEDDDDGASGDEGAGDEEGYTLVDLNESDLTLSHFVGRDGRAEPGVPVSVGDGEVVSTVPSGEFTAYKSEHEGYMGNYGNTADRWYHRAALVMWPRARAFVLRAKQSPAWAVGEISALVKKGATSDALSHARSLFPFWRHTASRDEGTSLFQKTTRLVVALGAEDVAASLLAPFGPKTMTPPGIALLLRACDTFGLAWAQRLFEGWRERVRHDSLLPVLPQLCEQIARSDWSDGRTFAEWLLAREVQELRERLKREASALHLDRGQGARERVTAEATALVEAAVAIQSTAAPAALTSALTGAEPALPLELLGDVLQSCLQKRSKAGAPRSRLKALHAHALKAARAAAARPPRKAGDWSISSPVGCTCELCRQLTGFLVDANAVEYPWPLAEPARRHVHTVIDQHELPVSHQTRRQGRPYTLVLRKKPELFDRDAHLRAREAKLLTWLERNEFA